MIAVDAPGGRKVELRIVAPDNPRGAYLAIHGGGLAVVPGGRIGVLRRQAVFDADGGETGIVGDAFQHGVVLVGRAHHQAAAMERHIGAAGIVRGDDPQRDPSAAASVDLDHPRSR